MKLKALMVMAALLAIFSGDAFAQTTRLKGKITGLTKDEVTLDSGGTVWKIKRAHLEREGGVLAVNSSVTLVFPTADAHKEGAGAPAASAAPKKTH